MGKSITAQITINAPIAKVWECWNKPEAITKWAFAADDWQAPVAENDLRVGGTFKTVMAAKDKSASFDSRLRGNDERKSASPPQLPS